MKFLYALAIATIAPAPGQAVPQQPTARPELLTRLVDCRKLPDDAERLRCFDRQVAAFDEAEQKREVVVVDRAEIRRTRRSLFGLSLPKLKLFGGDDDEANRPEFTTIETTITSAQQSGGGCWLFTLEDGAQWVQSDTTELPRTPKPGQHIRIRRALMGNYQANVEKQGAIKVRRINGGDQGYVRRSASGYCARM